MHLNPNNASGCDGVSGKCYFYVTTVVLPLKIIFQNILSTSIYTDVWKLADVTPIFKKKVTNNQLKTIDQYLYSLFAVISTVISI